MRRSHNRWLVLLLTVLTALNLSTSTVRAQVTATTVGVYYVGPEDEVAQAIDLAKPYLARVDQPDLAQVIVINNAPLSDSLDVFSNEIQQGRVGLVLFCGPLFPQSVEDLRRLLGLSTFQLDQTATPAQLEPSEIADPLQDAITWSSAPPIQARTVISNPNLFQRVIGTSSNQVAIQRLRGREQTQALIVGPWYTHPSNAAQRAWPYFNYLVYRLIADAANTNRILNFADYPPSPTPQRTLRWAIAGGGLGLMLGTVAVFYLARRRLYLRAEPLSPPLRLDTSRSSQAHREIWRQAGFHRPLAGLLAYLPWSLLFLIPALAYDFYFLPALLMPEAQGLETWLAVSRWTLAVWLLLDAGTGVAAVRLFSIYRTRLPQHAYKTLQFYVWWQLLSGAIQLGIVCLLIMWGLPAVGLAHLAYYLLARVALQFPGFLGVFALAFRARQRFDYEQFLNVAAGLSTLGLQVGCVIILRQWGAARVAIGPGVGGSIGLAVGAVAGQVIAFVAGAGLWRRDGLALSALFLPTFDSRVAGEVLAFGIPWAVGAALPAAGALAQIVLLRAGTPTLPISATSLESLIVIAATFELLLVGMYRGLMPALAEASSAGYSTLLRYYVSQGIRYGAWVSFFLFAALGAFATPLFSTVLGSGYGPIAPWIVPMLAWGALRWTTWLPDRMLEAAGRPGLVMLLSLLEQLLRLGGLWLGISLWGLPGLFGGYAIALLVHALLGRIVAGGLLVRAHLYTWQSVIAPAAAGLVLYLGLDALVAAWQPPTVATAVMRTTGLLYPALLGYAFLTALLGGWDAGAVAELQQAVAISGIGYPFAWVLLQCVRLGTRISPLHGRFPVGLRPLAQEEARELTFAQTGTE